jgi:hypothetical protein
MPSKNIFAIDIETNKIVLIDVAPELSHGYKCCDSECRGHVYVRRGNTKDYCAHFVHYGAADGEKCPGKNGGETREHYACKYHVAKNIQDYAFCKNTCRKCHKKDYYRIGECTSHVETKVPDSTLIADVLLIHVDRKPSIVTLRNTNRMSDKRRIEMNALGVAVIEVRTAEIERAIADDLKNPRTAGPRFVVDTSDNLPLLCDDCEHQAQVEKKHIAFRCEYIRKEELRAKETKEALAKNTRKANEIKEALAKNTQRATRRKELLERIEKSLKTCDAGHRAVLTVLRREMMLRNDLFYNEGFKEKNPQLWNAKYVEWTTIKNKGHPANKQEMDMDNTETNDITDVDWE